MKITTQVVAQLKKISGGAPFAACKKALESVNGNIEAAIEAMQKAGQVFAQGKANRMTGEGAVAVRVASNKTASSVVKKAVMLILNSETDFVANSEPFQTFLNQVADLALNAPLSTHQNFLALRLDSNQTVEQARQTLVSKVGENIQIREIKWMETQHPIGYYIHKGQRGCVMELKGGTEAIAKDLAVQVVVNTPHSLAELAEQDFYKDPSKTVEQYVSQYKAKVLRYMYGSLDKEIEIMNLKD